MTRVPKSIKNHYIDSFLINSGNLKSFLSSYKISNSELEDVSLTISKLYNQKVDATNVGDIVGLVIKSLSNKL